MENANSDMSSFNGSAASSAAPKTAPCAAPFRFFSSLTFTLLLLLLGGGLLLYSYALVTVDDTFITLRYARNLAHGLGPVFNAGERVEGFSNPLWVLTLAGLAWMPIDAIMVSKLASAFCYLLGGTFLLKRVHNENKKSFLACLFYLASLSLVIWGVSGMETSLYALLLLLWALTVADETTIPYRIIILSSLLLMTRPEAPMPVLLGFGVLWVRKKPFLFSASIVFAVGITLLSLRFFYYHDFLPNTYYAKHFQTFHRWPITLFGYVRRYYFSIGLIPLLALMAYQWKDRSIKALGLLSLALWPTLFSVLVGGDWMPVFRFLIPTLPICIWLGMRAYSLWILEYQRVTQVAATVALGVYVAVNVSAAKEVEPMNFSFPTLEKIQMHASYNPGYFYMTNYLKTLSPPPQNMAVGEVDTTKDTIFNGAYHHLKTVGNFINE